MNDQVISSAISAARAIKRKPQVSNKNGHSLFRSSRKEDKEYFEVAKLFYDLANSDNDLGLSLRQSGEDESIDSLNSVEISKLCPYTNGRKPVCNNDKYRKIDGSCNHKVDISLINDIFV